MALPAPRRHPRRQLTLGVVVCTILIPLAQVGMGALSVRASSLLVWLVGTPLAYLVIAGVGAFCLTGGLTHAQARARGSLVGILAGAGAAALATLAAAGAIAVALHNPTASVAHPIVAQLAPPPLALAIPAPIPTILVLVFFAPVFLAVNLLGLGLATLGGLLGGVLRASLTRHEAPVGEQPSRVNVAAIISVTTLLAILVTIAATLFVTGAFSLFHLAPAP